MYKTEETKQIAMEALARGRDKVLNNERLKKEEQIKIYEENPSACLECGCKLDFTIRKNKFCSSTCSAKYNNENRKNKVFCIYCKKEIKKKHHINAKYCSKYCNDCYNKDKMKKKIEKDELVSFSSIRKYLMDKYHEKCSICGWGERNSTSNTVCLDVHHIDGDYKNNKLSNVQLLCPNCHSLTNNYKMVGGKNRLKSKRKR